MGVKWRKVSSIGADKSTLSGAYLNLASATIDKLTRFELTTSCLPDRCSALLAAAAWMGSMKPGKLPPSMTKTTLSCVPAANWVAVC